MSYSLYTGTRRVLFLLVLTVFFSLRPVAAGATAFEDLWRQTVPVVEKGLELLNEGLAKDEKGILRSVAGLDSKYYTIIRDTFGILAVSDAQQLFDTALQCKKEIIATREAIAGYRKKLPSAPESSWNPLADTKKSLREDIEEGNAAIAAAEARIGAIKQQFKDDIARQGLPVSGEQVDALFLSVDGEDIVTILSMAGNIKLMLAGIEKQLAEDGDSVLVRTYAGIYMMINEAYAYAHQVAMDRITTVYQVKLREITARSKDLISEARSLSQSADARQREILNANIASNELTLSVAERYRKYLASQLRHLEASRNKIDGNVKVATNTYKTIDNASELIGLMKTAESDIDRIFSFELPEFTILHDDILRREFDAITLRMQTE